MHMPSPCSTRCAPSRLEWRPSRLRALAEALVLAGAPWLIAATDLPEAWRPPAVLIYWVCGGLLLARELYRAPRLLWLQALPGPLLLDGQELEAPTLQVRGAWVHLPWAGAGRGGRLLVWPDTLRPAQRRELRLAVRARAISRNAPTMAP